VGEYIYGKWCNAHGHRKCGSIIPKKYELDDYVASNGKPGHVTFHVVGPKRVNVRK